MNLHLRKAAEPAVFTMAAELNDFIWSVQSSPCWHCGLPCNWIDIDFEAYLHPGECERAKWEQYRWDLYWTAANGLDTTDWLGL